MGDVYVNGYTESCMPVDWIELVKQSDFAYEKFYTRDTKVIKVSWSSYDFDFNFNLNPEVCILKISRYYLKLNKVWILILTNIDISWNQLRRGYCMMCLFENKLRVCQYCRLLVGREVFNLSHGYRGGLWFRI